MKLIQTLSRALTLLGLAALVGCASAPPPKTTASTAVDRNAAATAAAAGSAGSVQYRPTQNLQITPVLRSVSGNTVAQLEPPKDLWERIRRGFAMQELDNGKVDEWEQWYTRRPDYIERMTQRSSRYLFHVVEELERRNMPTELALLPFIESAFNPQAFSSAKASGMWQFMPSTGKYFQLKQSVFHDERRDVQASTRAALDYLQKLHRMFGDWHLALAAYNWGEGSVGRAIAKNQKLGLPTGYWDLSMPDETRNYVPKLQAVKNIVAQPQTFSVSLPAISNHPYFQQVNITRDMDVALAAKLAEIPLDEFKALNSSANKPVILAAGTPQILLPWDNAAIFERNLESRRGMPLATWTAWMAPTTMHPAEAAAKVGMNESEFRAVNNIQGRVLIKAGSALLVPRSSKFDVEVSETLADQGQMSLTPEVVLQRRTVKARKADTLATLARRYNVTSAQIAQWNKSTTSSAKLKPGQSIVLYVPAVAKGGKSSARALAKNSVEKTTSDKASKTIAKAPKASGKGARTTKVASADKSKAKGNTNSKSAAKEKTKTVRVAKQ